MKDITTILNKRGKQQNEMSNEVKKSFVTQFAQNQNHHQTLFIQFLSVVIFALIAYGYVYINTSSYVPDDFGQSKLVVNSTDSSFMINEVEAKTFQTYKDAAGRILSYSKVHLVGTYLFGQLVLVVLSLTLLHMGYTYRRDQQVVHAIRLESLGESNFKKIFPSGYVGTGKRFINYLPNFYAILYVAIFIIQLIIYWSIFLYFNRFPETITKGTDQVLTIFLKDIGFGYNLTYRTLKLCLAIPIGISFFAYFLYFSKYNTRINNIRLTTQLAITQLANVRNIYITAFLCLGFAGIKIFCMYYFDQFSMALLTSAILNLATFSIHLWTNILRRSERGKNISNGIVYFIAFAIISLIMIFGFINHKYQTSEQPLALFLICLLSAIVFYVSSQVVHHKLVSVNSNKAFITHQLKQESYFFILLLIAYALILFSKVVMLDYLFAGVFGLLSLMWSIRSITYLFDEELGRIRKNENSIFSPPGQ